MISKKKGWIILGYFSRSKKTNVDSPMTLVAVTCMSSGEQSWKDRSLFDVTVIFSFITEFSFILHSEASFNFSMWRVRPSASLMSTLHNTREEQHNVKCAFILFVFLSHARIQYANILACASQLKWSLVTTVLNRNFWISAASDTARCHCLTVEGHASSMLSREWQQCHSWLSNEAIWELP